MPSGGQHDAASRSARRALVRWTLLAAATVVLLMLAAPQLQALLGSSGSRSSETTAAPGAAATGSPAPAPASSSTSAPAAPLGDALPGAGRGRWFGFYVPGAPADMAPLQQLEASIGRKADVVSIYMNDREEFPAQAVGNAVANGSVAMITLGFARTVESGGVVTISEGMIDDFLDRFAAAARQSGATIWLRPFPEMNGNWSAWSGAYGSNTSAQTVAAFKYVHDRLLADGATNVKFVWNVNGTSVSDIPHDPHNTIESYWPGDAYVDYVSIDAYNWGLHTPGVTKWQSANAIFGHAYRSVTALTDKPLFIAETGCSDKGGDKAAWIADFYSQMGARFPRVTGVCWFDTDKEEDWRIEQTPATLAAIQQVVRDGY